MSKSEHFSLNYFAENTLFLLFLLVSYFLVCIFEEQRLRTKHYCGVFHLEPMRVAPYTFSRAPFVHTLIHVQDNISPAMLKKIKPYVENPNMAIDVVTKVSKAASGLCMFVHAMDVYSKVKRLQTTSFLRKREATTRPV